MYDRNRGPFDGPYEGPLGRKSLRRFFCPHLTDLGLNLPYAPQHSHPVLQNSIPVAHLRLQLVTKEFMNSLRRRWSKEGRRRFDISLEYRNDYLAVLQPIT